MKSLLLSAITSSIKAGEEILKVYESDFSVEHKQDNSPLTIADKNAHKVISGILSETNIPVLSEEGKEIPYAERKNWSRLWIIDPLDGTKEFIKRNGEFTVNIALVENGIPLLGVIYAPVKKDLYFGVKDTGSYKFSEPISQFGNLEEWISKSEKLPAKKSRTKFTVVASSSHMTDETIAYIEMLKKKHGEIYTISAGSSIKICLVAEGSADCYPRFGPTMEWDTAAGQAIAENAGKQFLDMQTGMPMIYNREFLKNNSFVVQ